MVTNARGYTIIEVMLFLAISGALAAAIMLTAGANISAQRYKDAVATFESDLQQQFEAATAVVNNRSTAVGDCSGATGQSDCLMLGSYTVVRSNGEMTRYVVHGKEPAASPPNDEYELLRSYQPTTDPVSAQGSAMQWGTGVKQPGASGGPLTFGLMVVRSPETGSAFSFFQTLDDANLAGETAINLTDLVSAGSQRQQVICVDSAGWLAPESMAVVIGAQARSANSVEVFSNGMLEQEGLSRCY